MSMNLLVVSSKDVLCYNSFLVVFLIFLFGLSDVISLFLPFSIIVSILTLLFVLPSIILSYGRINRHFLLMIIGVGGVICFQFVIHLDNYLGTIKTFFYFISIGVVGLFVGINKIDWGYVYLKAKYLALLNFLLNILYVRMSYENIDILSMRFGYGILPSAMFFLSYAINKKSLLYSLLFMMTAMMIFIWGSRGALLVILIYLALVFYRKNRKLFYISILMFFCLWRQIVSVVLNFINILPFDGLKLKKMEMMLTEGIAAASSGRDELYQVYWKLFEDNVFWGNGVGFWEVTNSLYPHNLVLQAGLEFGVMGMLLMLLLIILALVKVMRLQGYMYECMLILFSIVVGRLLVSSSYWERPEFWLLFSLLFLNKRVYGQKA